MKADPDFYLKSGIGADHLDHPDGVYGWSLPLGCPGLKAIPLACGHLDIFKDGEALSKVISAIISLLNMETLGEPCPQSPEPHLAEQANTLPDTIESDQEERIKDLNRSD